jgi:hypothetical protein
VTFLGAIVLEERRHRAEAAATRRSLLATYLGRLYVVVGFMSQWPDELPESLLERLRRATFEQSVRVRARDWIRTQRELRETFGEALYDPLYRFTESYADLQLLPLRQEVRDEVRATAGYVERLAKSRSASTLNEWPALRRRLLEAIGASGDTAAIEAVKATEAAAEIAQTTSEVSPPRMAHPYAALTLTLLGLGVARSQLKHLLRRAR